jgi:hypothetical protein
MLEESGREGAEAGDFLLRVKRSDLLRRMDPNLGSYRELPPLHCVSLLEAVLGLRIVPSTGSTLGRF